MKITHFEVLHKLMLPETLQAIPAGKPCLENLSADAQFQVNKVYAVGAGTCSRCRWSAVGCLSCNGDKLLKYWLQKDGFHVGG